MKMKKKALTSILVLLIAIFTFVNYNNIKMAFAENYTGSVDNLVEGKMIDKGSTIIESTAGSVNYADVYVYLDAKGNMLTSFATAYSSFWDYKPAANQITIGKKCLEVYEENNSQDDITSNPPCDIETSAALYLEKENEIAEVKAWKVESVNAHTFKELCELYNTEIGNSHLCSIKEKFPTSFELDDIVILKAYTPPTFEFKCEPKELKYKETTNCELIINADYKVSRVEVSSLEGEYLELNKIEAINDWKYTKDEETGKYIFEHQTGVDGTSTILNVTLTAKEDITTETKVNALEIAYTDIIGNAVYEDLKDDVSIKETPKVENEEKNEEKKEDNPDTRDLNFVLISLIAITSLYIVVVLLKEKYE